MIIVVRGIKAQVIGGVWSCGDPELKALIEGVTSPDRVGGWEPNPDFTLARQAVERLGGEVIECAPRIEIAPDVIYCPLRPVPLVNIKIGSIIT